MRLELWTVREHEGLALVRKVASGSVLPPVNDLSVGTYYVCDDSGNRLKVTVEDARDRAAGEQEAEQGVAHGRDGAGAG